MAALPSDLAVMEIKPEHTYYAEVDVFRTDLELPIERKIERTSAHLALDPKTGTYKYSPVSEYNIEGIISYKSGYTQVAGHPSAKVAGGFSTLATSVLEGVNILDVITADRVVAQISTVHAPFGENDPVPSVTFLGTRFENLKIGGHVITVHRNLDILGPKPVGGETYFDDGVAEKIKTQQKAAAKQGLPDWATETYRADRSVVNDSGELECSLVDNIDLKDVPGRSFGHVIDLPHFGRIFLGELTVSRKRANDPTQEYDAYKFTLNMIRVDMGCIAKGTGQFVTASTNGKGTNGAGSGP